MPRPRPAFAAAVIEAQIAASRQVQEELHATWQAEGRGPFDQVPDLKSELRPRLDALNDELVQALAAAAPALATPSGREAFRQLATEAMAARSPEVRALALAPFAAE